jgi:hypothetical protein
MTATSSLDREAPRSLADLARNVLTRAAAIVRADGDRERMQRDALLAFSVRVASAGLLYLSQVVLARWMGSFEYGIYVFVWTWVLMLGGLSHAGLNLGMIRLVPEYRERNQIADLRGLLRGGRILALTGDPCGKRPLQEEDREARTSEHKQYDEHTLRRYVPPLRQPFTPVRLLLAHRANIAVRSMCSFPMWP